MVAFVRGGGKIVFVSVCVRAGMCVLSVCVCVCICCLKPQNEMNGKQQREAVRNVNAVMAMF